MEWKLGLCITIVSLGLWGILGSSLPLALGLVLLFGSQFLGYVWRKRRIDGLIQTLTHLQDKGLGGHLDDCLEGQLGVLQSEVYKLVDFLQEQAGAADHGKRYMADLLADVSHQLKTPLTSIGIMLDILAAPELDEEKRLETVGRMQSQVNKLNWLIRSLLVLSQLDAGVLELKREEAELCTLLDSVCDGVAVLAEVREVSIHRGYGPEPISLICDREWTREAISNIVKNCIEHSPGGEVRLELLQHNFSTQLTIRDNGAGIPKEELPHIFERFYKGRNSSAGSVGLGLALANQIILRQNGMVEAESTEGVGTVFSVRFYPVGR